MEKISIIVQNISIIPMNYENHCVSKKHINCILNRKRQPVFMPEPTHPDPTCANIYLLKSHFTF